MLWDLLLIALGKRNCVPLSPLSPFENDFSLFNLVSGTVSTAGAFTWARDCCTHIALIRPAAARVVFLPLAVGKILVSNFKLRFFFSWR